MTRWVYTTSDITVAAVAGARRRPSTSAKRIAPTDLKTVRKTPPHPAIPATKRGVHSVGHLMFQHRAGAKADTALARGEDCAGFELSIDRTSSTRVAFNGEVSRRQRR